MPSGSINQYAGKRLQELDAEAMPDPAQQAKAAVLQQLMSEMGDLMAQRVQPQGAAGMQGGAPLPPAGMPIETAVELPVVNKPESLEERLTRLRGGM